MRKRFVAYLLTATMIFMSVDYTVLATEAEETKIEENVSNNSVAGEDGDIVNNLIEGNDQESGEDTSDGEKSFTEETADVNNLDDNMGNENIIPDDSIDGKDNKEEDAEEAETEGEGKVEFEEEEGSSVSENTVDMEQSVSENTIDMEQSVSENSIDTGIALLSLDTADVSDSLLVENAEDLITISNNVANGVSDYKGMVIQILNDIDLSGVSWTPIGISDDHPFRGSIQGNGHTISGLTCNNWDSGLLGYWDVVESVVDGNIIDGECFIENLKLIDLQLGGRNSGGLVSDLKVPGKNHAIIRNCTVIGTIGGAAENCGGMIGTLAAGDSGTIEILNSNIDVSITIGIGCSGGVIGQCYGAGNVHLIMQNLSVVGELSAWQNNDYGYTTSNTGGLIGFSSLGHIKIEECSKKGIVSCRAYYAYTGGFIGTAELNVTTDFEIKNSYCNASIVAECTNGSSSAGGLIGHTEGGAGDQISITNTYATGSISANNKAGFVCWHGGSACPVISNSYFDRDRFLLASNEMVCSLGSFTTDWLTSNITNSSGLTTAEMKQKSSYNGWDFENVWCFSKGENQGYPVLGTGGSGGEEGDAEDDLYDSYELQVYSEFSNSIIGVGQTMALIPAMSDGKEVLKNENGWSFSIEDESIAEVEAVNENEYGPEIVIKGKSIGTTRLHFQHIATGRSIDVCVMVVDNTEYFNISSLEKYNGGIYNSGILMDGFRTEREGNGYNVSFTAYNGRQHYGAVEVYDKDGNLIDIEKISKFDKYETGFMDVVGNAWNLLCTIYNDATGGQTVRKHEII